MSPGHPLPPRRVTTPAPVDHDSHPSWDSSHVCGAPSTLPHSFTQCQEHPYPSVIWKEKNKKPNWCFKKWNLFLGFVHVTESYCLQITLETLPGVHQTTPLLDTIAVANDNDGSHPVATWAQLPFTVLSGWHFPIEIWRGNCKVEARLSEKVWHSCTNHLLPPLR